MCVTTEIKGNFKLKGQAANMADEVGKGHN
jgi:hypothetical protein